MERSWSQMNRRRNSFQGTGCDLLNRGSLEGQLPPPMLYSEVFRRFEPEIDRDTRYTGEKSDRSRVVQGTDEEEKTLVEIDKLDIVISTYDSASNKDFNRSQKFCQPMNKHQEVKTQGAKSGEARNFTSKAHEKETIANSLELNNKNEIEIFKKGFQNLQIALDAARTQLADTKKEKLNLEEEIKTLKGLLTQTRKENSQKFRELAKKHEQEIQEIKKNHQDQIRSIKENHEQELKKKDEEFEILNECVNQDQETELQNHKVQIDEYEQTVQYIKIEFEAEIAKLSKFYQKKLASSSEEKLKLQQCVETQSAEIIRLQALLGDKKASTTSNAKRGSALANDNKVAPSLNAKKINTAGLQTLLSKIKYN